MLTHLQTLQYEFIREEVGYGTIDLLCDVGGTLSLLMGASLLTCCELLEVAWLAALRGCCVRHRRRKERRKTRREAKESRRRRKEQEEGRHQV